MPAIRPRRFSFARNLLSVVVAVALAGALGRAAPSPAPATDDAAAAVGPTYADDGRLLWPEDYREWIYVASGLGMTYGPARAEEGKAPRFDNVFVNRDAYRTFLATGTWPDRTMLVLEVRSSETHVSINNGGRTQGRVVALEAAVKDRARSPEGGWAYYSFDGPTGPLKSASPLPASASCYACHRDKGAVDNTFVQFYPTLLDAATRHGTLRPAAD